MKEEEIQAAETQAAENPIEMIVEESESNPETATESIEKETNSGTNYVKVRVDRAKTQKEKEILQELGVEDLTSAKDLISTGKKALDEVLQLKQKLEAQELQALNRAKTNALTRLLDKEEVFDSDALINYIDLDKVVMKDGAIQDAKNIIANLKEAKPNFFGTFELIGDTYIKGGGQAEIKSAVEKQEAGDNVGAVTDYLTNILK